MPQQDLAHVIESPGVVAAIWTIGILLVVVMLRELRRIPARLLVLMATAFLDMVGLLMIVPVMPFYVKRFAPEGVTLLGWHLGEGQLTGWIVSAFVLAQSISSPMWGRFSDRVGRRPALLVAIGASSIAFVIFGFADSLWLLLLSRLVQGAGGGTVGVIQAYVADTEAPQDRTRALGWLSAATNLGVAIGPVIGHRALLLADVDLCPGDAMWSLGHGAPGFVAGAIGLLTLLYAYWFLPESNRQSAATARAAPPAGAGMRVLLHPLEPPSRLIWSYAIAIGAFQGTSAVLALFLNERFGIDEDQIGYFYMYIGAISVFARALLLGRMVDRFGELRLSRIGIVTLAFGLCLLPLTTSLGGLALAVATLPLGTAFTFPCVTAMLSRVIDNRDRGLYMGLQQRYGGYARIAMPIFYGAVYDGIGPRAPYWFAAAFVLPTILLGIGLGSAVRAHESKQPAPPSAR